MSEKDYTTILASLLFARDAGRITEEEYASAYNAVNRAVDFEYMYEMDCERVGVRLCK